MKNDVGLILEINKFEEKKLLLKILSKENGIIKGVARKKSNKDITYNVGNLVDFNWFGRENSLGVLSCELKKSYATLFLMDKIHSEIILLLFNLLNLLFYEKMYLKSEFFDILITYMDQIVHIKNSFQENIVLYFQLENLILNYSGHFENDFIKNDKFIENINLNEKKITFLYNNILHIKVPDYILRYRKSLLQKLNA